MKRFALDNLIKWKNTKGHKPLIIQGARQVGKTWLMKEFGRTQYKNVAYIWFEGICRVFNKALSVLEFHCSCQHLKNEYFGAIGRSGISSIWHNSHAGI